MSIAKLLNILFYFSGIISIMIGSYSLYRDSKSKLNRTFFALCISLFIWAIGFSMAIDAANLGICIFWRRISAFSWGAMYSIFLHYYLVFIKKDMSLKKWWLYLLIYAPTAITIFIFAISNNIELHIIQIAPIINLIPIITIYYSIIRYALMSPEQVNETEVILNESTRARVYVNLSITLVAGSFVSFILQYLFYMDFIRPLYSSAFILFMGITIYILKTIKVGNHTKDFLLILIISLIIPSVALIFIEFGSVTIWAFSFLFIIISLLFNKPIVLSSIAISILSTQVLVWILKPEVSITIDKIDHMGRIGILCIAIGLAFYVSKIYIQRLRHNADQLSLQRFVSEISSDFINVNQSNIDEKMNWVIRILGKLFSIDQINILLFDLEHYTIKYKNIWDIKGKSVNGSHKHNLSKEDISWLMNNLISNESIYIPDVDRLPETADGVKNELKKRQISSLVAILISENEKNIRILEFAFVNTAKELPDEELRVLNTIADIFADALLKVEAENEISYMAYHDNLTGLPNRRLFNERLNQAIVLAKRTEKMIGIIFIDLDSFKTINDTLGHEGGDYLLKVVSEKLINAVPQSDTVSRFGGDEFVIMIDDISCEKDIVNIMEKIMLILEQPFSGEEQEFNLTISAGIAVYPFNGTETGSLIKKADIAMYKAKENGKNQYVIYSSEKTQKYSC